LLLPLEEVPLDREDTLRHLDGLQTGVAVAVVVAAAAEDVHRFPWDVAQSVHRLDFERGGEDSLEVVGRNS
jgi:hypothetical protein